jgi:hypothetical protein
MLQLMTVEASLFGTLINTPRPIPPKKTPHPDTMNTHAPRLINVQESPLVAKREHAEAPEC